MALNLEAARRKIEAEMSDEVRIDRPSRFLDGTFNSTTGVYTPDPASAVYLGPAMVSTYGQEPRPTNEGGEVVLNTTYSIRLPIDFTDVQENDIVTVTDSLRDAGLVGHEFLVVSVIFATFAVSRKVLAELRTSILDA